MAARQSSSSALPLVSGFESSHPVDEDEGEGEGDDIVLLRAAALREVTR
jgi:hypothetical protein